MDWIVLCLGLCGAFVLGRLVEKEWPSKARTHDEFRYAGDMQRLSLGSDDVLVLMIDRTISDSMAVRLRESLEGRFGNRKVVVLSDGMRLGAVSS